MSEILISQKSFISNGILISGKNEKSGIFQNTMTIRINI